MRTSRSTATAIGVLRQGADHQHPHTGAPLRADAVRTEADHPMTTHDRRAFALTKGDDAMADTPTDVLQVADLTGVSKQAVWSRWRE